MALESFEYSKTWRSADDFPTIETDETQVRDDIQCLFDEIAGGLNGLTTELNSGGIDTAQLKDGAVTTDKLSLDVRAAIAEKELYWATYGSSNGLDIYTAIAANHLPVVKYSGRTYILSDQFVDVGSGYFNFVFTAPTDGGSLYYVVCNQTTLNGLSWTNGSQVLGTYSKPGTGIPSSDMATAVQTSLGKADTAYQKPGTGIPGTDLASAVTNRLFPSGGTSHQLLTKHSNTDYDVEWEDPPQIPSTAADVGAIAAPASPNNYDLLTYYNSEWKAIPPGNMDIVVTPSAQPSDGDVIYYDGNDSEWKADAPANAGIHSVPSGGTSGYVLSKASNTDYDLAWVAQSGGGGSSDYDDLTDKPQINSVTLSGNKTTADLGIKEPVIVTYGTTSFADVHAAWAAGKTVICKADAGYINGATGNDVWAIMSYTDDWNYTPAQDPTIFYFYWPRPGTNQVGITVISVTMEDNQTVWDKSTVSSAPPQLSGTPQPLGTAARGSATTYSRSDHVHDMPSASDVGASPAVTEVTVSTAGSVTQALDAGKMYHFTGALTALTITLNAAAAGQLAQYHFDFDCGSTAPTVTIPNTVTMTSGNFEASKHYEVDILNNFGAVLSWANS